MQDLETLVWTPDHTLTDRQIDQFLVVSRSVGTFARALDCSSSVKQPSLHMSAAAASRDVTLVSVTGHRYCCVTLCNPYALYCICSSMLWILYIDTIMTLRKLCHL